MDDRTLAFYDDAWEMRGPDKLPGRHMVLRIEQSRENRNELHFVIEKHRRSKQWGNPQWDEMSIYVPAAATFLAPVVEWLDGGAEPSGKTDADRLAAVIAEARKMNSEHGQSWNAISGRRILNVLGIEPEEWNPEESEEG